MKISCKYRSIVLISASFLLVTTTLDAQNIYPPFDANEVISGVNHRYNFIESRNREFLVDTNAVYVPAGAYQGQPAIAFDGTNYLIIWCDERLGYDRGIFGARVNSSGIILDSAGIVISTTLSSKNFPSVTFNGTNYLVVWDDTQDEVQDIYGVRVSPEGTVLDPDGIAISTAPDWQCDPAAASEGTNYFVVWADRRKGLNNFDVYGTRVSPAGTVLDPDGIVIATANGIQGDPNVVFDGTNYFVVWDDNRTDPLADIYGARVSPDGIVLDPDGIMISDAPNTQMCPAVSFDGTNYLVAWDDLRSGLFDIYCARINQSGIVLDTAGIFIKSTGAEWQWFISVAFDGVNYLVVWQDSISPGSWVENMDVYGARVTPSGIVLDTAGIPISTEVDWQYEPVVASDGTNSLVAWCDGRRFLGADIYGARLNQAGTVLDPEGIVISSSANYQAYSSVAFDGSNYFVAWQDDRNGENFDIYGTRINQSGTVLDPFGILISTADHHQTKPSVAFDGTNYLVVCEDLRYSPEDPSDIFGARVSQSGVVLDTLGIPITTASGKQCTPAIAFGSPNYLVVWDDAYESEIYCARINQSGIVLDTTAVIISTLGSVSRKPSVAFDGTNYFVVWRHGAGSVGNIFGARINQSGTLIDTNNIAISTAAGIQDAPSVAFDGVNYLVVWGDNRAGDGGDIYCARVNPLGIVLDTVGIPVSTAPYTQCEPFVAFDGSDYLIVWQDNRNVPLFDLYGAQLNTSGVVVDSFVVSIQPGNQFEPAIAHGIGDQLLITYAGWTDSINEKPTNTMRVYGKFYPFVGISEDPGFTIHITRYSLMVYPNPFRNKTDIRFQLLARPASQGEAGDVSDCELKIYDATGRLVKDFRPTPNALRLTQISWDGSDQANRQLPSGVYFLKFEAEDYSATKKLLLIR